jgi:hypothetical protein
LKTQDLESSGFPEGEKRWHPMDPILQCTMGVLSARMLNSPSVQYS